MNQYARPSTLVAKTKRECEILLILSLTSLKKCMVWNCLRLSDEVSQNADDDTLYPWLPLPPPPPPSPPTSSSARFSLMIFLIFFPDDKASGPDVFTICSFIPRVHFEIRLVMVSFYDYEK